MTGGACLVRSVRKLKVWQYCSRSFVFMVWAYGGAGRSSLRSASGSGFPQVSFVPRVVRDKGRRPQPVVCSGSGPGLPNCFHSVCLHALRGYHSSVLRERACTLGAPTAVQLAPGRCLLGPWVAAVGPGVRQVLGGLAYYPCLLLFGRGHGRRQWCAGAPPPAMPSGVVFSVGLPHPP